MASNDKGLEEIPEGKVLLRIRRRAVPWSETGSVNTEQAAPFLTHPRTDILVAVGQIESNYDEVTDSFDSMSLKSELLRGMSKSTNCVLAWMVTSYRCICIRV